MTSITIRKGNGINASLDCYKDTDVQLLFESSLFTLISAKKTRSLSFTIPSTGNNRNVLEYPDNMFGNGDAMRRKFNAVLSVNSCVFTGDLVILDIDKKDIKVSFIVDLGNDKVGEFLELYGNMKITDILINVDPWSTKSIVLNKENLNIKCNGGTVPTVEKVISLSVYDSHLDPTKGIPTEGTMDGVVDLLPTVNLFRLIVDAFTGIGYKLSKPPFMPNYLLGLKLSTLITSGNTLQNINIKGIETLPSDDVVNDLKGTSSYNEKVNVANFRYVDNITGYVEYVDRKSFYRVKEQHTLTFTTLSPTHIFIANDRYPIGMLYSDDNGVTWKSKNTLGKGDERLGTSEVMPAGRLWLIGEGLLYLKTDLSGGRKNIFYTNEFFGNRIAPDFKVVCSISGVNESNDNKYNNIYFLKDNLPDFTFKELLSIVCALNGSKKVHIDEENNITFVDYDVNNDNVINLDDSIINVPKVTREIPGISTNNIIKTASRDYVPTNYRDDVLYSYINDNANDKENILLDVPVDMGVGNIRHYGGSYYPNHIFIDDFAVENGKDGTMIYKLKDISAPTIVTNGDKADSLGCIYGLKPYKKEFSNLADNQFLRDLIKKSTVVNVVVKMYAHEFKTIKDTTVFSLNGARFFALSARWADNNTAELTLIMLP